MSLLTTEIRGQVAILTFNRPETMNAIGEAGDGLEVRAACEAINVNRDLRCVVLTGAGRAFSAGGDLKAMRDRAGSFAGAGVDIREGYRNNIHHVVRSIYGLELPVIAAINGPAIGLGLDLACLADIRIASDRAKFGSTFLRIGLIPGDGGAWLLPRVVGMSRAAQLLFTADVLDAQTAMDWGLISEIHPAESLMDAAIALAEKIAVQPPHALRMGKSLLRHGQAASFDTIMEWSAAAQAISHATDDHMEGVRAVLDKRLPTFRGS